MKKEIIFEKLKLLLKNAYVPYSKFPVSCIVFLKDGTEVRGVNVENAAFPSGICAERVALPQVFAMGYNKNDIESLAIMTSSKGFGSPCGMCRQFMSELFDKNVDIEMFNIDKYLGKFTIDDFLPYQFSSKELK
ncbi:cytidine deaminase [Spiroplasma sabaudiense Ar-1343]|uniref:Cytidine deaminase n=1 Tax=Spiroplasma sabaudiense Ar-1343 TaxID=1276257 RepID=W6A9D4_9MOLU|nr:cytidine deaminase [Spiroplasma sabaudiense]AHI53728.1 cytidine deaminase [Spiroplasma sabaudiense Ar-1343]